MIKTHSVHPVPAAIASLLLFACALGACENSDPARQHAIKTTRVLGEPGTHNAQFVYPRGMDVFEYHSVPHAILVDKTARIQLMNLKTGDIVGSIKTPRWDRGQPTGLTVSNSLLDPAKLAVYIADTHEFQILMYELPIAMSDDPQPTEPDFRFGSFGEEPGQFIYPTDVAVDTDQHGIVQALYVTEYGGNDRINRFSVDHTTQPPTLTWQAQIGIPAQEVDASDDPIALARPQSIELWTNPITHQREIVLTDASHHRVGRVSTSGQLIAWYGGPLDTSQDAFRFPYGLTILQDNTALIAEFGANRITRIDLLSGQRLFRYGESGRSIGQLAQPWAVGVVGDQLVILDSGNSRLQFAQAPTKLSPQYTHPRPSRGATP